MEGQDTPVDSALAVVLFDFDGVLTHADTFELFVRERYCSMWWASRFCLSV